MYIYIELYSIYKLHAWYYILLCVEFPEYSYIRETNLAVTLSRQIFWNPYKTDANLNTEREEKIPYLLDMPSQQQQTHNI